MVLSNIEVVDFRFVVLSRLVANLLANLFACEYLLRRELIKVQQQPKIKARIAQRDSDSLLTAQPNNFDKVLNVPRTDPMVCLLYTSPSPRDRG